MGAENPFSFAQIVGYGALAFGLASMGFKNNRTMNQLLIVANSLWVLHFYLLSALAGAVIFAVHVLRSAIFLIDTQRRYRWVSFWGLITLYTIFGALFHKETYDLVPILGSYGTCIGIYLYHGNRTKLSFAFTNACIFFYSAIVFSIGGMLAMLTGITLIFITMWRSRNDQGCEATG